MSQSIVKTKANMDSQGRPNHKHIEARAADWLAQRDLGPWAEADEADLNRWLNESSRHMVAFIRLEAAFKAAERLRAVAAGIPRGVIPTPQQLRASPYFSSRPPASPVLDGAQTPETAADTPDTGAFLRHRRHFAFAAAATLVLAVSLFAWNASLNRTDYATPVGGLASVPISDGSKITLNTDSRIRIAMTKTERRVDLQRGEAFFDVAHDPTRPFVVHAKGKTVTAVGTKFSVREDSDGEVRVVVAEGRVLIEDAAAHAPSTRLAAGNIARTGRTGVLVQEKPLREVEEDLSWRTGYVVFHATPLANAVAEFNRYNAQKIAIEDPSIAGIEVGGNFRATNVEAFIRLLQDGFPVKVDQREDRIILSKP